MNRKPNPFLADPDVYDSADYDDDVTDVLDALRHVGTVVRDDAFTATDRHRAMSYIDSWED